MKTRQPFHPNQPFQLPHLHKATTHKPHRLHLLREIYPLLIQVVAVLFFLSKTRSREGGPTFVLWGRSREAAIYRKVALGQKQRSAWHPNITVVHPLNSLELTF